jgi:Bacterial Ig-like domain (group 3)/Galactose oxidase, central domain/Kelch motif
MAPSPPALDHLSLSRHVFAALVGAALLGLTAPSVSAAPTGQWAATAALSKPRYFHTATRLADGSVLVAAGNIGGGATVKAERYDPVARRWAPTGPLTTARQSHTATLLPDGRVLAVGGLTLPPPGMAVDVTPTAELYDPATGTWSPTGSMLEAGIQHTVTLLPDGRVLVAGGSRTVGLGALSRAEIYDPASGTWTATGSMHTARSIHSAALLPDGRVLVVGGITDSGMTETAELYDPVTGTWTPTGSTHLKWEWAETLRLADGRVLLLNGPTETADKSPAPELYDPATGRWTTIAAPTVSRTYSGATLLADGRVLLSAGNLAGKKGLTATAELYDPATGEWKSTGSVAVARRMHTAVLLADGTVLITGGQSSGGKRTSSNEIFTPPTPTDLRTATTLASSANPSIAGQSVTFTARVNPVVPGAPVAGKVTFTDGTGKVLCKKVKVAANQAACTKKLKAGTYAVTATFTSKKPAGNSVSPALGQAVTS